MTAIDINPIMTKHLALLKSFVLHVDMPNFPVFTNEDVIDNLLANLDLLADLVVGRVLSKKQINILVDEFRDLTMVLALLIKTPEEYVCAHNFLVARAQVALEKSVQYECYEAAENLKNFLRDACGI